jgi:hypothetical protein
VTRCGTARASRRNGDGHDGVGWDDDDGDDGDHDGHDDDDHGDHGDDGHGDGDRPPRHGG